MYGTNFGLKIGEKCCCETNFSNQWKLGGFSRDAYKDCSNVIFVDFEQLFDDRDGSTEQNI